MPWASVHAPERLLTLDVPGSASVWSVAPKPLVTATSSTKRGRATPVEYAAVALVPARHTRIVPDDWKTSAWRDGVGNGVRVDDGVLDEEADDVAVLDDDAPWDGTDVGVADADGDELGGAITAYCSENTPCE